MYDSDLRLIKTYLPSTTCRNHVKPKNMSNETEAQVEDTISEVRAAGVMIIAFPISPKT